MLEVQDGVPQSYYSGKFFCLGNSGCIELCEKSEVKISGEIPTGSTKEIPNIKSRSLRGEVNLETETILQSWMGTKSG